MAQEHQGNDTAPEDMAEEEESEEVNRRVSHNRILRLFHFEVRKGNISPVLVFTHDPTSQA